MRELSITSARRMRKRLVPGEVIAAIIEGTEQLAAELRDLGVGVYTTGGGKNSFVDVADGIVHVFLACRHTAPAVVYREPAAGDGEVPANRRRRGDGCRLAAHQHTARRCPSGARRQRGRHRQWSCRPGAGRVPRRFCGRCGAVHLGWPSTVARNIARPAPTWCSPPATWCGWWEIRRNFQDSHDKHVIDYGPGKLQPARCVGKQGRRAQCHPGGELFGAFDNCGYHLAGNQTLVASDGRREQDAVGGAHAQEVVDVHYHGVLGDAFPHAQESYNGGMGSNGLTSARHDVFRKELAAEFPESYDNSEGSAPELRRMSSNSGGTSKRLSLITCTFPTKFMTLVCGTIEY